MFCHVIFTERGMWEGVQQGQEGEGWWLCWNMWSHAAGGFCWNMGRCGAGISAEITMLNEALFLPLMFVQFSNPLTLGYFLFHWHGAFYIPRRVCLSLKLQLFCILLTQRQHSLPLTSGHIFLPLTQGNFCHPLTPGVFVSHWWQGILPPCWCWDIIIASPYPRFSIFNQTLASCGSGLCPGAQ